MDKLTRRALLAMGAAVALRQSPVDAKEAPPAMVDRMVALATQADLMRLDPQRARDAVAFRGGTPSERREPSLFVLQLLDGEPPEGRRAEVWIKRVSDGWHLDYLSLHFGGDLKLELAPLLDRLRSVLGAPQDHTPGTASNTVLLWPRADRVVVIVADTPGTEEKKVLEFAILSPDSPHALSFGPF